jgi:hypothetical protein
MIKSRHVCAAIVARYEESAEAFEVEEIPGVTALAFGLRFIASKVAEVGMDATSQRIQMRYIHGPINGEQIILTAT